MGLTLEDFFFDGAGCDEPVDEAVFLLAVTPDTREGLLICGWVPIYESCVSMFNFFLSSRKDLKKEGNK